MHMIMLVLNDPDKLDAVLDGWHAIGIRGVTVMESTGIYRRRPQLMGARYAFGFPPLTDMAERGHYTLFTVVADAEVVERCHGATERIVGPLLEPNTGVMASWRLDHAWGARHQFAATDEEDRARSTPG